MSVFDVLKSIGGVVGKVVGVASSVIAVAKPIVYALRDAVPEIGKVLGFIEEKVAVVGTEADDFLDRNLHVVTAIENVSGRGVVVMQELNALAVALRRYSQELTPDRIDEAEAADLIARFERLYGLFVSWGPELEAAAASLEALEADK